MLSAAVAHTRVTCAANEYIHFSPPSGQTCGEYMRPYIDAFGGYLTNAQATSNCSFCKIATTDAYLKQVASHPQLMWRNFGLMWAYIVFNVAGAVFFYWLVRVPKHSGKKNKEEVTPHGSKQGSIHEGPVVADGEKEKEEVDRDMQTASSEESPTDVHPDNEEAKENGDGAIR